MLTPGQIKIIAAATDHSEGFIEETLKSHDPAMLEIIVLGAVTRLCEIEEDDHG